jgi:hypothetical protein
MVHQTSFTNHRASPAPIWTRLATEHRAQVIRLMAQLAFKLVVAQPNSPIKEEQHAVAPGHTQNSD